MIKIKGTVGNTQVDLNIEYDADKFASLMLAMFRAVVKVMPEIKTEIEKLG